MAQTVTLPSQGVLDPGSPWRINGPTAIAGDTVIADVGPGASTDGGAAIFVRSGTSWSLQTVLRPAAAQRSGSFLTLAAVAASGSRVAAWWQRYTCTSFSCTARAETVEIFARTGSTWAREATILTPTIDLYSFGAASGIWGRSPLAMTDDTVMVGAPQDFNNRGRGHVYVYQRAGSTWTLAATLTGIYPDQYDQFGGAVAIDGLTAIVSAGHTYDPAKDLTFGFEPGGAYIFRKSGGSWTREAFIVPPAGEVHFGKNLDISGDRAVIAGNGVYVFERGGGSWPLRTTLVARNDPANTLTNALAAVSIDGGIALVHRLNHRQDAGNTQIFARGVSSWVAAGTASTHTYDDGPLSGNSLLGFLPNDRRLQVFTLDVASVPSPPQLSVSHPTLYFGARGSLLTPAQTEAVTISNARGAAVSWTVAADQPWLTATGSAIGSGTFTVSVKPGTYAVGTLRGSVTVTASGVEPVTVDVTFTSYASTTAPWGSVDSPAEGATGVTGSMPMTGWALHQVGIQKVSIFREAVGAEGPPSTLVFIGDAVMVEGARPDVEAAAGQPFNYRAGWGLMILTNMLPSQGNGTFRLHAIAQALDGSTFELGTRTITCANAAATAPFGAIDTPGQGATVAGAQYINWGWALVPKPRMIPLDGSTVTVYVDGAPIGHPTYGINRSDIAGLFPGLANSSSAIGYRAIDTTALANGVHTLAWVVADDQGNASGIGSRYFTVQNNGVSALTTTPALARSMEASPLSDQAWSTPVRVRRGYAEDAAFEDVPSTGDTVRLVASTELDRLEIDLGAPGAAIEGEMLVGREVRPLPIGSSLDARTGIFVWQPGVGFFGQYELLFRRRAAAGTESLRVTVVLGSRTTGTSDVAFAIDTRPGVVDGSLVVGGWAFDRAARSGTGIDAVHVWAYPLDGSAPSFVGAATLGGDRPDVADAFGPSRRYSGYGVRLGGLAPGTYDVAVFPRSAVSGRFVAAKIVRVTVR